MLRWPESRRAILLAFAFVLVSVPSGARAASVVNGDFETGTLAGWQVHRETQAGDWFAYSGTDAPIGHRRPDPADPVQPPPRGAFAAIADQANPDNLILYQDVALEPGVSHQLGLLAYYDSYEPIAVPNPDTLSVAEEALRLPNGSLRRNQQFRIDVMRSGAPLDSLDPADILRPVFATKQGSRLTMAPTRFGVDLSAFAGQTVRIRIAVAATEEVFNAGVDDVSITSAGRGGDGPRRAGRNPTQFGFGRLSAKGRRGTATLRVHVLRAGLLRVTGKPARRTAVPSDRHADPRRPIQPLAMSIATARTVTVHVRPTPSARTVLRRRGRLRVNVAVTFMPFGGRSEVAVLPVVLRLAHSSK